MDNKAEKYSQSKANLKQKLQSLQLDDSLIQNLNDIYAALEARKIDTNNLGVRLTLKKFPASVYSLHQQALDDLKILQQEQDELTYTNALTALKNLKQNNKIDENVEKHLQIFLNWVERQKSGQRSYYEFIMAWLDSDVTSEVIKYDAKLLSFMLNKTHRLLDPEAEGSQKTLIFRQDFHPDGRLGHEVLTEYSKNHHEYKTQLLNEIPGAPSSLMLRMGCTMLGIALLMATQSMIMFGLTLMGMLGPVVTSNIPTLLIFVGVLIVIGITLCAVSQLRTGPSKLMMDIVEAYEKQENMRRADKLSQSQDDKYIQALQNYNANSDQNINQITQTIATILLSIQKDGGQTNRISTQLVGMLNSTSTDDINVCAQEISNINKAMTPNRGNPLFFEKSKRLSSQLASLENQVEILKTRLISQVPTVSL